jgi:pimeloyl-ACP methyl ester carboxylesterase
MHVLVNGVRLFFDVEGAKLVPDGSFMREKPTLLMLHGGPGSDHSIYKPAYSDLADVAQITYLDHRGNGRSEDGPKESWNLAQWGDDVRVFCDTLGISSPIVLGASFGGMVALAYATRHPAHPSKLVLISTEAAGGSYRDRRVELFERFGGPEVGALARRRFLEVQGHPDQASLEAWRRLAIPLYPDPARSEHGEPRGQPVGSAAMLHQTGRREPHVQHVPGAGPHPVSDAGARRRGRPDTPNREPGGYRGRPAGASGAVRTL